MIAVPWYLLAAGIVLVIIGYLFASMESSRGRHQPIHHKMRDDDIVKQLNRQESLPTSAAVSLLGYLLVFVSIAWRIVAVFV